MDATEPTTSTRVLVVINLPIPATLLISILAACHREFPRSTLGNGPAGVLHIVVHEVTRAG